MDYHNNGKFTFLCRYHVVFCTKYKRRIFKNGLERFAKSTFQGITQGNKFSVIAAEVFPNYVHLLIDCDPAYGIDCCIRDIKRESTKALIQQDPSLEKRISRIWTREALIFTVGQDDQKAINEFVSTRKSDTKRG